jgi:hypothetical protein
MTMLLQGNLHNKDMKMVNRPSHGNLEDVVLCSNPHFLQWGVLWVYALPQTGMAFANRRADKRHC